MGRETADEAGRRSRGVHRLTAPFCLASCLALSACGGGASSAPDPSPAPSPSLPSPPPPALPPVSAATRTATLAYGRVDAAARPVVGRFAFAVLSMWPSMGNAYMQGLIDELKTINPGIKLAQYIILNEWDHAPATNSDAYAVYTELNDRDWWVRDAQGRHVQWTTVYGNDEVNVTAWAPADASGRRWPQWKAAYDSAKFFQPLSRLDYVFNDNVMVQPRYDADLMRTGTNQPRNDPAIMAAFRQGFVSYWNAFRAANPGIRIIGNTDNDLGSPEYKGKLEGAFNECMMGKSWSIETSGGWTAMMARYRATLANTQAPHDVILQVCGTNGAVPAQARYGFASALLEDGYFMYTVDGLTTPFRADEFDAPLGTPAEPPPVAATASGIWMRRYTNGLVLVNPTASAQTLDVGPGYRRMSGTQDPAVNTGEVQSAVSLPAKSGLIMLKR